MARALGMNVLGLTLATNYSGASDTSHQSVLEESGRKEEEFQKLVRGVLRML